jgi:hypothetical protein
MIISHKYKYLFIEIPHTGTTAISKELREYYDGVPILRKHAYYPEFLQIANAEEKEYFVFAGIRNPLDEAITHYHKLKSNHGQHYTSPEKAREQGGWVTPNVIKSYQYIQDNDADFARYFARFYVLPHDNVSSLSRRALDSVIRFEHLQSDFAQVLQLLGIEQKRPLPVVNRTSGRKRSFESYYTPEIRARAVRVFGPFMKTWGYEFPPDWGPCPVPWSSQVLFDIRSNWKRFYWRHLKWGSSAFARAFRALYYRSSNNFTVEQ